VPTEEMEIEKAPIMLFFIDLDGTIAYANKEVSQLLGYSQKKLIGQNINTLWHPQMPKAIIKKINQDLDNHETWVGIVNYTTKKKDACWVKLRMFPTIQDHTLRGCAAMLQYPTKVELQETLPTYKKLLKEEALDI
jgi:PAS domain S-box-containing protein